MTLFSEKIKTPIGILTLVADDGALRAILWEDQETTSELNVQKGEKSHPLLEETKKQLNEYFKGKRKHFDLPLHFEGTDFQKKVWKALQAIPFGETRSYGDQAKIIGCPKASRAVGAANGRNPIPIIVPCHRVIGANGKLTGFGGGLDIKEKLLKIENKGASLYR